MKSNTLMKGILLKVLIIVTIIFSFSSCEKDEEIVDGNYYVKYSIYGNGAYGRFSNWYVTTPQGRYTNEGYQTRSWSQTFGPVNKGFKCMVQIDDYIGGDPTIHIHVSKNDEPFVLKKSSTGHSSSYTIDF